MIKFETQNGYVWKSKRTGDILSEVLYLGKEDIIENYEQVQRPQEEFEQ